jgi:NAD(P)-dependent dehydrogenase (short-subunit alcohol dehydrogenase family)
MGPPRAVLVTGASTGIGAGLARRLDAAGYCVFAGVRRREDGERLRSGGSERLNWLRLDVSRPADIAYAAQVIAGATGDAGLYGLVNNAGVAVGGPLEFVPIDAVRQLFEVNVLGLLAVTQAMLPMLRLARGRIVNVGSISGKSVAPLAAPYAASKHAVEALSDGLRLELDGSGVAVSLVEPGPVRTPIWEKGRQALVRAEHSLPPRALALYGARIALLGRALTRNERRAVPVERVVTVVLRALEAVTPRPRYLVGRDARLRALLRWLLPDRWNDALVLAYFRRLERRAA